MIPSNLTPGSAEWNYEKLGWEERRERVPGDYGPPQSSNGPRMLQGFDPNNLNELETPEPEMARRAKLEDVELDSLN